VTALDKQLLDATITMSSLDKVFQTLTNSWSDLLAVRNVFALDPCAGRRDCHIEAKYCHFYLHIEIAYLDFQRPSQQLERGP
jgi:hypothetical protein